MGHLIQRHRSIGACLAVVAVGLLASGCDWYGFGYESPQNGDNAIETTITPANVSTLTAKFSATDGTTSAVTPQAVVNGVLYASNANGLRAYSANGTTGCSGSPVVCAPLWTYSGGALRSYAYVSSHNVVYATMSGGLDAFDAAGQTNCSGTPKVCQPLWSAPGTFGTPTVSNGSVFVTTTSALEAFDANGSTNCSGSPKVCAPLWTATLSSGGFNVVVSGGIAYTMSNYVNGVIAAFDANGCSGSVCSPLWVYQTDYPPTPAEPYAVYNYFVYGTMLYVSDFRPGSPAAGGPSGDYEGFDVNGVNGCGGTPYYCSPTSVAYEWTESPSVAGNSAIFVHSLVFGGPRAFAANGLTLQWSASASADPLAIGGSVLYASDSNAATPDVFAFDTGGSAGCSGSPVTCDPLWSVPGTNAIPANGKVYLSTTNTSGDGEIVTYGLPS